MTTQHSTLWHLFRETGDPTARDTLVRESLGIVHCIARKMRVQLGNNVSYADLVSSGSIGLLEAVSAFDPSRGFAFSTFAAQRIRGAILDDLRACDPLSRQARQQCQRLAEAERLVERRVGRNPTAVEVAAEMDVSLDTYWEWKGFAEFDEQSPIDGEGPGVPGLAERVGERSGIEDELEDDERRRTLREALLGLSERERAVVSLYYFEELKQREIASILKVSEGRVSQILNKALEKLRGQFAGGSLKAA
jgi:RNA polymerase sigma factor FliA